MVWAESAHIRAISRTRRTRALAVAVNWTVAAGALTVDPLPDDDLPDPLLIGWVDDDDDEPAAILTETEGADTDA